MRFTMLSGVRMKLMHSLVMLTLLPSGCDAVTSSVICPKLKEYSQQTQAKAAEQLPKAGKEVQQLVVDYGRLRDQCRAIGKL